MKPAEKRDWAIFIVCLTNLLLLLTLLFTGCGQEQAAPQPIIVNVTAPETETPAVTETPVIAEAADEPPAVEVEEPPAVEEAADPEVVRLASLRQKPCGRRIGILERRHARER